ELAPGRCGVKIILLDAIFDGWLGDPVVRRYDGHGSKAWLPQPRHEFAAIRGAAHWTAASRLMSRIVFMVGVRMRWLGREASSSGGRQSARPQGGISNELSTSCVLVHGESS